MGWFGLRRNADLRSLSFITCYFVLLYVLWTRGNEAVNPATDWPRHHWFWYSWLIYLSFLGAVCVHNTIHCPMFFSPTRNKIAQVVLSCVYGHPVSAYVPGHNLSHHKYTQQRMDVMRTQKLRFRWHLLNLLWFPIKIGLDMLDNDAKYFAAQKRLGRPVYRQMVLERTVMWTLYAVCLIVDWRKWLMLVFIPHTCAKFSIITLNLLQHDGCDADDKYNFARNFVSPLLNFFTYNNGYHGIHHVHPGLHWSMLKEAHEKEVKPNLHPNLDQPSILWYIFKTFVIPGQRVDYTGAPLVLPPADDPIYVDEPWFYDDTETYSSTGDHVQ